MNIKRTINPDAIRILCSNPQTDRRTHYEMPPMSEPEPQKKSFWGRVGGFLRKVGEGVKKVAKGIAAFVSVICDIVSCVDTFFSIADRFQKTPKKNKAGRRGVYV